MKIKIKRSVLKQAVEQVMNQGLGNPKRQLVDRIVGLTDRCGCGRGIEEARFVDLLDMIVKLPGGEGVLMKFLEMNQGTLEDAKQINEVTPPEEKYERGRHQMKRKGIPKSSVYPMLWRAYDKEHGIKPKSK